VSRVYFLTVLAGLLLLFLSLTRLRLRLYYRRRGRDDEFSLEFSIWRGLLCYKLEVPVVKMKVKTPGRKKRTRPRPLSRLAPRPVFKIKTEVEGEGGRPIAEEKKQVRVPGPLRLLGILTNSIRLVKRYRSAIVFLLRRVHLRRLQWRTEFGAGDPAQTGFLAGTVWGIKSFLLTVIHRLFASGGARPVVSVAPDFEKARFGATLDCIFEVRIGYIILAGFKALLIKLKS